MIIEERNIHNSLSFEEKIVQLFEDCQDDIVFLFVIIGVCKESFGLSGLKLLYAVQKIILTLTRAGAKPVRDAIQPGTRYRIATDYGDTPEAITRMTMRRWKAGGYSWDGGDNDIWFAAPESYNSPWTEADMARDRAWRTPPPVSE
jgi:hypothetical protein